jgi:hypothetical protein
MALQLFIGPGRFFSFLILYTVRRTPWRGISTSQGLYVYTEQHKHRINAHSHPCQLLLLLRNLATDCLPRICLCGNLFTNPLSSNECTCNITVNIRVMKRYFDCGIWMNLAQDHIQCQAMVLEVSNLRLLLTQCLRRIRTVAHQTDI